jgi:endo-1,4-beta-xylanase
MRSEFLQFRVLLLLLLASPVAPSASLRQAADEAHLLVSAAVRPSMLSENAYSATLAREFNMVEAEDAMKWWTVRREEGSFDFREGDHVVSFAQAHGMKVRGHCLVWDHNNPEWLVQGHLTPAEMSRLLQTHITTVMRHYAGKVFAWDVVNEAMDEGGRFKNSPWYNQPGIGLAEKGSAYIEQAFRWAHEADPQALLFYNEAEGEGLNRKSDSIYAMVKDFKRRGVPIDGVGLQMHIPDLDVDTAAVAANIARLTALGVQVHITELDVSLPVDASGIAGHDDLVRQAEVYRGVVRACLQNPGCTAIQTWGFTDKYSWIGSHSHGTRGAALLFDRAYTPKAAYDAVLEEILARTNRQRWTNLGSVGLCETGSLDYFSHRTRFHTIPAPCLDTSASIMNCADWRFAASMNGSGPTSLHPAAEDFAAQAGHYSAVDRRLPAARHAGIADGVRSDPAASGK